MTANFIGKKAFRHRVPMAAPVSGSPTSVAGFGEPGTTYPWL